MTEKELASAIGVSLRTLEDILADKFPEDPARWEKFAKYFRKDVDFFRTGGSTHSATILTLSERTSQSAAGRIRKTPLLTWHQMGEMVRSENHLAVIHADATVETTDVSGKRTIAVKVKDDSKEPLFNSTRARSFL